jgi:hypothetical protein
MMAVMVILPGLTSTKKNRIPAFVSDLRASSVRTIALFPTCLSKNERAELYTELASIPGLRIPHIHLRADCGPDEIAHLVEIFGTEAFNIHPRASTHPFESGFGGFAGRVFVENVDVPIDDAELEDGVLGHDALGGICPDFSHLENARLHGRASYVAATRRQLVRFRVGCCHMSAIRVGVSNDWAGEWDHHAYARLSDFDYLKAYCSCMPAGWASLELENSLAEQLEAKAYIEALLAQAGEAPYHYSALDSK